MWSGKVRNAVEKYSKSEDIQVDYQHGSSGGSRSYVGDIRGSLSSHFTKDALQDLRESVDSRRPHSQDERNSIESDLRTIMSRAYRENENYSRHKESSLDYTKDLRNIISSSSSRDIRETISREDEQSSRNSLHYRDLDSSSYHNRNMDHPRGSNKSSRDSASSYYSRDLDGHHKNISDIYKSKNSASSSHQVDAVSMRDLQDDDYEFLAKTLNKSVDSTRAGWEKSSKSLMESMRLDSSGLSSSHINPANKNIQTTSYLLENQLLVNMTQTPTTVSPSIVKTQNVATLAANPQILSHSSLGINLQAGLYPHGDIMMLNALQNRNPQSSVVSLAPVVMSTPLQIMEAAALNKGPNTSVTLGGSFWDSIKKEGLLTYQKTPISISLDQADLDATTTVGEDFQMPVLPSKRSSNRSCSRSPKRRPNRRSPDTLRSPLWEKRTRRSVSPREKPKRYKDTSPVLLSRRRSRTPESNHFRSRISPERRIKSSSIEKSHRMSLSPRGRSSKYVNRDSLSPRRVRQRSRSPFEKSVRSRDSSPRRFREKSPCIRGASPRPFRRESVRSRERSPRLRERSPQRSRDHSPYRNSNVRYSHEISPKLNREYSREKSPRLRRGHSRDRSPKLVRRYSRERSLEKIGRKEKSPARYSSVRYQEHNSERVRRQSPEFIRKQSPVRVRESSEHYASDHRRYSPVPVRILSPERGVSKYPIENYTGYSSHSSRRYPPSAISRTSEPEHKLSSNLDAKRDKSAPVKNAEPYYMQSSQLTSGSSSHVKERLSYDAYMNIPHQSQRVRTRKRQRVRVRKSNVLHSTNLINIQGNVDDKSNIHGVPSSKDSSPFNLAREASPVSDESECDDLDSPVPKANKSPLHEVNKSPLCEGNKSPLFDEVSLSPKSAGPPSPGTPTSDERHKVLDEDNLKVLDEDNLKVLDEDNLKVLDEDNLKVMDEDNLRGCSPVSLTEFPVEDNQSNSIDLQRDLSPVSLEEHILDDDLTGKNEIDRVTSPLSDTSHECLIVTDSVDVQDSPKHLGDGDLRVQLLKLREEKVEQKLKQLEEESLETEMRLQNLSPDILDYSPQRDTPSPLLDECEDERSSDKYGY